MPDYIPTSDADLNTFAAAMFTILDANEVSFGLVDGDAASLGTLRTAFNTLLGVHNNAQTAAKLATQNKNAKRAELVAEIRSMVKRIQANPNVTDAQRAQLGITIPDTTPTAVPAPSSRPVVSVMIDGGLKHTVKLTDEATPLSNAKPAGAIGAQIFVKYGATPPVTVEDCVLLGTASKASYEVTHTSDKAGQNAHYLARWVTRAGLTGPTSQLTSATVAV